MSLTTYYLEMCSPPEQPVDRSSELQVIQANPASVAYYRFLFDEVGRSWNWTGRKVLSDSQLESLLCSTACEVHVAYYHGSPAGFVEFNLQDPEEVEFKYFGMIPSLTGKGLGRDFLCRMIQYAWTKKPRRLWLHTCTNDHPKALGFYEKAGFQIYQKETE